jgi:hypothetical protein
VPLPKTLPLTLVVSTGAGSTVMVTFSLVEPAVLLVALTPFRLLDALAVVSV